MWGREVSKYRNENDKPPVPPADKPHARAWIVRTDYFKYDDVKTLERNYRVKLPPMFVSEALREEIPLWYPEHNVLIKCRTGGGKNYFFEKCIIPWCIENRLKILYLSNRITLGRQQKTRLAKIFGMERQLELYSDEGLDLLKNFGCVTALSYQQLENWWNTDKEELKKLCKQRFDYVVVDEPHYFLDDAAFNPLTEISLNILTKNFMSAIKVYMSATPEQIFPLLRKYTPIYEAHAFISGEYDWLIYEFEEDYDKTINAFAFRDMADLSEMVKRSHDKWVIFVESIKQGELLKELLSEGVLVTAASKGSREADGDEYHNIVANECFDSRVLITTKVLENGVNIRDTKIKNVAIFSNDRTAFLQELGRVRRMPSSGSINVYIHSPDYNQILAMYKSAIAMHQAISVYESSPTEFYQRYIANPNPIVNIRNAVTVLSDKRAYINGLLDIKICYFDIPFWKMILERIQKGDADALIREKFSWVGKDFSDDAWRGCLELVAAKDDLVNFLEAWKGKMIAGDDKDEFRNEFSEKFKRVFGSRKVDKSDDQIYGVDIMKKRLEEHAELGFILESGKKGWMIKTKKEIQEDDGMVGRKEV